MDFYSVNVVAFVALNAALSYLQWRRQKSGASLSQEKAGGVGTEYAQFKSRFLPVYLLVFGADWLQVCQHQASLAYIVTHSPGTLHIHHVQR